MAIPVPYRSFRGFACSPARFRVGRIGCDCALRLLDQSGISVDQSRISEAPKASSAPPGNDAQADNMRGEALAQSGKTDEALAEFNQAIALDPNNAEALYNRGLLYQGEKQHQLAIDDFTAANGLTPQQAEPLLGRAHQLPRARQGQGSRRRPRRGGAGRSAERRRSGLPGGRPMSALATRPRPPAHMAAPSTSAPRMKPRAAALRASAASPANATRHSGYFGKTA